MKHTARRRRQSLPQLQQFPTDPLMLEIQAASQRGDELLARALDGLAERDRLAIGLGAGLTALAVGASLLWHWLHPEWPLNLLPNWLTPFPY